MKPKTIFLRLSVIGAALIGGCSPATPDSVQKGSLVVNLRYPTAKTSVEMGQPIKSIVSVADEQGNAIGDAQVTLDVRDPSGALVVSVPATVGGGDVYRTQGWIVPHRSQAGTWTITARASAENAQGSASTTMRIINSISEDLLSKYGFWLNAPALKGIVPLLYREQGDAQNGLILWGGVLPSQHIFPESWVEIHWREGDFKLETSDQVRAFMLGALGDLGFTPTRELGPFEQVRFKQWSAWQAKARGQYSRADEQWMVFYAPEVNKTYAIGTAFVLAPEGIDAHSAVRDSFEVHPEVHASGTAPAPFPILLPSPELVGPELGTRFLGTRQPIVLSWKPLKDLSQDEFYRVRIDFNYEETNMAIDFATRQTDFTLPASLYRRPNCGVFNWQVTLMRQTGVAADGQPEGEPLSYNSLYWYVEWLYPLGEEAPFLPLCPNPQT